MNEEIIRKKREDFDYKDRLNEQRRQLLEEMRRKDEEMKRQMEAQQVSPGMD